MPSNIQAFCIIFMSSLNRNFIKVTRKQIPVYKFESVFKRFFLGKVVQHNDKEYGVTITVDGPQQNSCLEKKHKALEWSIA